jgi:hypothetical protein
MYVKDVVKLVASIDLASGALYLLVAYFEGSKRLMNSG